MKLLIHVFTAYHRKCRLVDKFQLFLSISSLSLTLSLSIPLSIPLKNSLTDLNKIQILTQLNKKKIKNNYSFTPFIAIIPCYTNKKKC